MEDVIVGISALESIPFFADLDRDDLESIVRIGHRASFQPGQAIVERGDPGDAMYIVLGGTAQVDVGGRYHDLKRGDFFGEMAVLAGRNRMATVKASEPVEALRIPASDFQAFLLEHPRMSLTILRTLVERLREVQQRIDAWMGAW